MVRAEVRERPGGDEEVRLAFRRCRACGSPETAIFAKAKRDAKGKEIAYCEWETCMECKITKMVTPWTSIDGEGTYEG